jgi:hypothetical protein
MTAKKANHFLLDWRIPLIGDFYTDLALKIIGGKKTAGSQDAGDIENDKLDTDIEVKGRSNKNAFIVRAKQLEKRIAETGFPYGNSWYALFSYRNKWKGSDRRLGNVTSNAAEVDDFLGKNLKQMFIVDSRLIEALRQAGELEESEIASGQQESQIVLRVERKQFKQFLVTPEKCFAKYKLRGFRSAVFKVAMTFRGQPIKFDLFVVLPRKKLAELLDSFQAKLPFPSDSEEFQMEAVG